MFNVVLGSVLGGLWLHPLDGRTMRFASPALAVFGLVGVALAISFSWDEYRWIGAEVVRAPFIDSTAARGRVTARYRVQSTIAAPVHRELLFHAEGRHWTGVDDAMRATRVVDVHRGDPLRYREHMLSTSRNPRGWSLILLNVVFGSVFGGLMLLFAFKLHGAPLPR